MISKKISMFALTALLSGMAAVSANAAEVIRHKIPGSDFPISLAIEIPASATVVNLSGFVPPAVDEKAEGIAAYGNTEVQTVNILKNIEKTLKSLQLQMSDVVKMQVYLVGTPEQQGKLDFDGFMRGYTQFFGTKEQPNMPTRSVFQVAGLANPGYLVEIEVSAVRP